MSEYAFRASVELETAASQAALHRLVRSVDDVKKSMKQIDVDPGIQRLNDAFKSGGPAAATKALREMDAAAGTATYKAENMARAFMGAKAAMDGNVFALAALSAKLGMWAAAGTVAVGVVVGMRRGIDQATDAMQAMMDRIDSLGGYYQRWASEARNASKVVVDEFGRVGKASDAMLDRTARATAQLTRDQNRQERVRVIRQELDLARGQVLPARAVEQDRQAAISAAEDRKAMASKNVTELTSQRGLVSSKAAEAAELEKSLRVQAARSGDAQLLSAHAAAKQSAQKLSDEARRLTEQLDVALQEQADAIADAKATIEEANAKAAIQTQQMIAEARQTAMDDTQQQGTDAKALQEAKQKVSDYALSQKPPAEQLADANRRIERTRRQLVGDAGPVSPAEKARLMDEQLANVRRRDEIQKSMADDARTASEAAKARAQKLDELKGERERPNAPERVAATQEDLFRDYYAARAGGTVTQKTKDERMIDLLQRIADANLEIVKLSGGIN